MADINHPVQGANTGTWGTDLNNWLKENVFTATGWLKDPVYVSQYITHKDDADTYLDFGTDSLAVFAGGVEMLRFTEDDSQDKVWVNPAAADVDFIVGNNWLTVNGLTGIVSIGTLALQILPPASVYNTAIGALVWGGPTAVQTTTNNTFIGYKAGYNVEGGSNTFIGSKAGGGNTSAPDAANTGDNNTAVGTSALRSVTTGVYNSVFGSLALSSNKTGTRNNAFGLECMTHHVSGGENSAFGSLAMYYSETSGGCAAFGGGAMLSATRGAGLTGIGVAASLFCPTEAAVAIASSGEGLEATTQYYYRYSYVLDGVETALSSARATVTTETGKNQVSLSEIPVYVGPKTCTARKLYRRNKTLAGYFLLVPTASSLADNTTTTYVDSTPDADLGSVVTTDPTYCIALGYNAQVHVSNQMVIGAIGANINDVYIGGGVYDTSPVAVTINASGGSGTNVAGAGLILAGGKGTGSAAGGSITFKTSAAGAGGSLANALSTLAVMSITGIDVTGLVQCDTFRLDQAASSGSLTCDKYVTMNFNGTSYKVPCVLA